MTAGTVAAMPPTPPRRPATARPVDGVALARHAARLARRPPPWLHEEVARRMSERLAVLKRPPRHVVDWGGPFGGSAAALSGACPQARRVPVEVFGPGGFAGAGFAAASRPTASPAPMPPAHGRASATPWWSWRRWLRTTTPAASPQVRNERELADGEADLLWSNMILHHLVDPAEAFERWRRLLAVDGILMFSTLGPGTLESLGALYRAEGWGHPMAPFVDMHDLGDMLVRAGFADPVMDQELVRLTWATPREALAELRLLGGNAHPARSAGLRTPRWLAALQAALARRAGVADGGRVTLEFEVVYGHAVRPPPRLRVAAETAVPLDELRGLLRRPGEAKGPTR